MSFFIHNKRKVFFNETGNGQPVIIIHGNSVSSEMHKGLAEDLKDEFRLISVDLPGHGQSERIEEWPIDFWYENSKVIYSLIKYLNLKNVVLLGYSGGALIALNTALEYPDSIVKVIADSFEGEKSVASFAENIFMDREKDKKETFAQEFWLAMHGSDWESVVDNDSRVIYEHHKSLGDFFHKNLSDIKIPVFLTGSENDEYISDFNEFYLPLISKVPYAVIKLYNTGSHPASLTVGKEYVDDLIRFIRGRGVE